MKLYSYWRSSTSFRVRAGLNLKELHYEIIPIDLMAGDQKTDEYASINPGAGVPSLVLDDGTVLVQSMAILEYLDTAFPEPELIPSDPLQRARVQAVAHLIALDIHPVNNTRVVSELQTRFGASQDQCEEWMRYWMVKGFEAVEKMLPNRDGFAFGDQPGLADLCIVAQACNGQRWGLDMSAFPGVSRIEKLCLEMPQIHAAHPDQQPEARGN